VIKNTVTEVTYNTASREGGTFMSDVSYAQWL